MRVEALRPEGPVKGFHVRVVGRLAGPREVDLHTVLIRPQIHDLAREFCPIIAEQHLRYSSNLPNPIQNTHHVFAFQALSRLDGYAFSREHVYHRQSAEASTN